MNNNYKKILLLLIGFIILPSLFYPQNVGLYIEFETVPDPLRLMDVSKDNPEATGLEKMDPLYKVSLGYRTPFFLQNWLRFHTALEMYGGFYWKGNAFTDDNKKTFNNLLTVGVM